MLEPTITEQLRRLSQSAQRVREHITESAGEQVDWRDVVDTLDCVRELVHIVGEMETRRLAEMSTIYDTIGG